MIQPVSASRTRARNIRRRLVFYGGVLGALLLAFWWMTSMPGASHEGFANVEDERSTALRTKLRADVEAMASAIGERHMGRPLALQATEEFLTRELETAGYKVRKQTYSVGDRPVANLDVEIKGRAVPQEFVIVGAHYDSAHGAIGADDNASGVAATLALARSFANQEPGRTLRFAFFTNEEQPHFQTPTMGSFKYAEACKARSENIIAMLSVESIGYFRTERGSQKYPFPINLFYRDRGDFIGFVGNLGSRSLTREVVRSFRKNARIASEGAALPAFIPGISWSDQWSFWKLGYPAVMVTDTAPFRNPNYHTPHDTADTLDYARFAEVVRGLEHVVRTLGTP